jgi:hypothetical protein
MHNVWLALIVSALIVLVAALSTAVMLMPM